DAESVLGTCATQVSSAAKPLQCLGVVPRHTVALEVRCPEVDPSVGVAQLRSAAKPLQRLGVALRHTSALVVNNPKGSLSLSIALLSGAAIPIYCLGNVLRHPAALKVHIPNDFRGVGIVPSDCRIKPNCSCKVSSLISSVGVLFRTGERRSDWK